MLITTQVEDGEAILTIWGEVVSGDDLRRTLDGLMREGHRRFAIDLGNAYVDSTALGEIVRTYTTVSREGGTLRLINLSSRITELLSVSKLLGALLDPKPLPRPDAVDQNGRLTFLLWSVGIVILLMLTWIAIGRSLQP